MKTRNTALTTIAIIVLATLGVAALLSVTSRLPSSRAEVASGSAGMVSSAHPLATEAGLEILKAGGNAFDAAVAVAAALNVVEPMMSGMGGYGTILTFDVETGRARFLNPSGRIPRGLDSNVFRPPTPRWRENRRGAKAVSTPGNANAWEAMWKGFGQMEWEQLFAPAIRLAEGGFELDKRTAFLIASAFDSFPEHARDFYGTEGVPLQDGERLVQIDLGRSLRAIAEEGAGALHGGPLGEAVDRAMREAGGFLTLADLSENQAEWWDPIRIDYRDYEIVTASPPANSFPALVRLGMMSRLDTRELGHNTAGYLHAFAEVTKHAFWVRLRYASDPEIRPVSIDMLLSEEYWQEQVDAIDPERASSFIYPGAGSGPAEAQAAHTTHFVVADRWGNVVSATQTLGNSFGSRIMPKGTGIWLNNSLAYCTFEPKGNPMDAFPGRHKLSGDVPAFIMKDDRPWVALGTPGGHTIGQTVPQMIINMIDFDMDVGEAVSAPRVSFVEPDHLAVEQAIPERVRNRLEDLGHLIRLSSGLGNAHALSIEYGVDGMPARFTGAADPRGSGLARGY
jgi:gamma-glutamyltranspeptidase/glutathione hydrolase